MAGFHSSGGVRSYHLALAVHTLGRHRIQQIRHSIGFEKQRELQRIGWEIDEVVRAIEVGGSVTGRTGRLEERVERALRDVTGAFEHQMLEQVSQARRPSRSFAEPTRALKRLR